MDKAKDTRGIKIKHWKIIAFYLLVYDVAAINASYFLGLLLRFDLRYSNIPEEYLYAFQKFAPVYTLFTVAVFYIFRLYNSLWRFASFSELNRILAATGITTLFHAAGIKPVYSFKSYIFLLAGCLQIPARSQKTTGRIPVEECMADGLKE